MSEHSRRPGIYQIGTVVEREYAGAVLSGWGLGLCKQGCICHQDPASGGLVILEDSAAGRLGLTSFYPSCTCCRPWEFLELRDIVHDLRAIQALPVLEAQP